MEDLIKKYMDGQHFDSIAVAIIDFKNNEFKDWSYSRHSSKGEVIYDLASLTKPLTNSVTAIKHSKKIATSKDALLLLNHEAGQPIGGRLPAKDWREQILQHKIQASDDVYSDFSSLRAQIEIEKLSGDSVYELLNKYAGADLCHWTDLTLEQKSRCPKTGERAGKIICGEVHDNNAFYIKDRVSHAGLFASVSALSEFLLNISEEIDLLNFMSDAFQRSHKRFIWGWDTVANPEKTLAGPGCSSETFGHLGFTGTSIWIDTKSSRGSVILTNATQSYWYDRCGLRELRRAIGEAIWAM